MPTNDFSKKKKASTAHNSLVNELRQSCSLNITDLEMINRSRLGWKKPFQIWIFWIIYRQDHNESLKDLKRYFSNQISSKIS